MTFSPYPAISLLSWQPQDQGIIAWTADPVIGVQASALTGGVLRLTALMIRTQRVVNSILANVSTAGATLTANENFAGLYDSAGNLSAQTGDQSASWTSTGLKTMTLTAPMSLGPGMYWVALLANGTTPPQFTSAGAFTSALVANQQPQSYRAAHYGTAQTSLPSPLTLSTLTQDQLIWAALI